MSLDDDDNMLVNIITPEIISDIHDHLYLPNDYTSIDIINKDNILKNYGIHITNEKYGNMNNVYVGTYNDNMDYDKVFIKLYKSNDMNYVWETYILDKYMPDIYIKKGNIVEYEISYIIYIYLKEKTKIITMLDKKGNYNFITNHNVAFIFNMFNVISGYYFYPIILGKGSYGVNYLAYYLEKNKDIAVKLLYKMDDNISPFNKEVFILKLLSDNNQCHTNILCYISSGYIDKLKLLYISTDYINGDNLETIIKYDIVTDVNIKYDIMLQLAKTLNYIHSKGILHLDIKPENILYDSINNNVYIIDFGLSCFYDKNSKYINYKCDKNKVPGTPLYMSPEMLNRKFNYIKSKTIYGTYTDVYSLGIVFIELLTKKTIFDITPAQEKFNNNLPYIYRRKLTDIFIDNVNKHDIRMLNTITNINIRTMLSDMISYNFMNRINLDKVIETLDEIINLT